MSSATPAVVARSGLPPAPKDPPLDAGQPPWQRIGKRVLGYGLLILFAVFFIFPFMLALLTSVKPRAQAANDPLALLPEPFTTRVFPELFSEGSPAPCSCRWWSRWA